MPEAMSVEPSWISGTRRFACDGEVLTIVFARSWQDRVKRATVLDDDGRVLAECRSRSELTRRTTMELGDGGSIEVFVDAGFVMDRIEVLVDGKEPRWLAAKPLSNDELGALLLADGIRTIAWGAFFLLLAAFFVYVALANTWMVLLIASPFALAGAWMLRKGRDLARGNRSSLAELLEKEPQRIGWAYGQNARGALSIVVCFTNGGSATFGVPPIDFDRALQLFRERAPHAAIGFTDAAREKFAALSKKSKR